MQYHLMKKVKFPLQYFLPIVYIDYNIFSTAEAVMVAIPIEENPSSFSEGVFCFFSAAAAYIAEISPSGYTLPPLSVFSISSILLF